MVQDLFESIVDDNRMHPSFRGVQESKAHRGAKQLMNEFFSQMEERDGNFVEQFQTTGFDARTFELGLFACFRSNGFNVDQSHGRPDFILSKGSASLAIEAVTSNPPEHLRFKNTAPYLESLSNEEILKKIEDEVPIKMGSPLYSKLKKRYWELPHCERLPLIFAIQPFHEPGSLFYTSAGLSSYLYGTKQFPTWTEDGELVVGETRVDKHQYGKKTIPSCFYGQPDTENISGVLFCNGLTISKFTRMAFQKGYHREGMRITRSGSYYDRDPNSALAPTYEYVLGQPGVPEETWSQGMVLLLNPNAKEPVPSEFLQDLGLDLTFSTVLDGEFVTRVSSGFHPYTSISMVQFDPYKMR